MGGQMGPNGDFDFNLGINSQDYFKVDSFLQIRTYFFDSRNGKYGNFYV